jgi:hypothetical protein
LKVTSAVIFSTERRNFTLLAQVFSHSLFVAAPKASRCKQEVWKTDCTEHVAGQ